jgi:hypothetical protein
LKKKIRAIVLNGQEKVFVFFSFNFLHNLWIFYWFFFSRLWVVESW